MKNDNLNQILNTIYLSIIDPILDFMKKKKFIIILTPIKTGSTSVYATLKYYNLYTLLKTHFVSKSGIKKYENKIKKKWNTKFYDLKKIILVANQKLRIRKIDNYKNKKYVIVTIRNPIDQRISSIFQLWQEHDITLFNKIDEPGYAKTMNFVNNNIETENPGTDIENWLKNEINDIFKIDVFSEAFTEEKGYKIFKTKEVSLLLMKMETMSSVFESAIKDFLSTDKRHELIILNVGEEKIYKESYKLIKRNIKIKKETLDKIVDTKYFKHFYAHQKEFMYERWSK